MYTISQACIEDIITYTNTFYPFESCGIIAASKEHPRQLAFFYPISNDHPHPRHYFSFNVNDWINVNYDLLRKERKMVCYVHSHIGGDPLLSNEDLQAITDYNALQAIIHYSKKDSPTIYFYRYNHAIKQYESYPLTLT